MHEKARCATHADAMQAYKKQAVLLMPNSHISTPNLTSFKIVNDWRLCILWGLTPVPELLKKWIRMQARTMLLLLPQHVPYGVCVLRPAADHGCVLGLVCGLRHACKQGV